MKDVDEKLKYEVANELGLFEKIKKNGWKSLTAKETGRIGGLMTKKKRCSKWKRANRYAYIIKLLFICLSQWYLLQNCRLPLRYIIL